MEQKERGSYKYKAGNYRQLIHPVVCSSTLAAAEVPTEFAADFNEAHAVLVPSPKSAAALARRSIQHILRDVAGTKKHDLNDQIDELIESKSAPSHVTAALHAVRTIGNFAAHPMKSASTGAIIEVEHEEAEWTLAALSALHDHYFVNPSVASARKDALNNKLIAAGKRPIL